MPVTTKIEPLDRDIGIIINETMSPQARSAAFAEFAREQLEEAKKANAAALGRVPPFTIAVDGRKGAALESVRPDGVIVFEFEMLQDLLIWIHEQLVQHSPVARGRDRNPQITYAKSHKLFADGAEVAPGGPVPAATEYTFVNSVPYARKIEAGSSSQAPDGVYQAVAVLARRRFGNIAKIFFTFAAIHGGGRNPAVTVRVNA